MYNAHMMLTEEGTTPARQAATNGLAVVGFIALIILGLSLAVYAARFVPGVVNGIGSAAVYLGSVFNPAPEDAALSVVPTATTTLPFGTATSTATTTVATNTATSATTRPYRPVPSAGTPSSGTYQIGGSTTTPATLHGLPDLIVTIDSIGYLSAASANTFVASSTVPSGNRPAVKFTIKNIGTNQTGMWRFSASIPTSTFYNYQSQLQQSLFPGESIEYTLGFDQANPGSNKMISITANFDHAVGESNENNNSASAQLTIIGS
jgi:hypothetical protein